MDELKEEILNRLKEVTIDCPDCEDMYDDQYCCTTCWNGSGKINVYNYLKENGFK